MLKSNGLHRPKIRLKKFGFSSKSVPANIAKKLPSQRCSQPLFNSSHKRPMFVFTGESGYTLGFRRKIAHSGLHAESGAFRTGPLSLPSERSARSQTSPGRVSERRTLPLLGLGRGCSQRTQRASGQRCAYARRCSEASRPRWAALLCLQLGDIAVFSLCAQYFLNVRGGGGITTLGLFHTFRKLCVARGQNGVLCRFGILAGRCSRRTQKAFGTAMCLCASLFRRRSGPAGLRDLFATW